MAARRLPVVLLPALCCGAAVAQECSVQGGTVMERAVACASEISALRHDEMVLALDALTGGLLPPGYDARGLLDSQALWEVQADATCAADAAFYGGQFGKKARYDCLARLAADRRDYLEDLAARVREVRGLPPPDR